MFNDSKLKVTKSMKLFMMIRIYCYENTESAVRIKIHIPKVINGYECIGG